MPTGGVWRVAVEPHHCYVCGELNACGLRLPIHLEGERAWAEVALRQEQEGWRGVAHGGILCALLDEVMNWALFRHDAWGVTVDLRTRFRRPVPIGRHVRAEGWPVDVRRRLLTTAGRIVDAATGELLCEAEGRYMAASEARKRELKATYRFRLVPAGEPSTGHPTR
ncbi:MAG TPA: PaaI family thioesterase [Candidatus Limnocylindrales bacterium]|nr:PaaI family thioesterase [Candidatus Limnocylindrales bacterium]